MSMERENLSISPKVFDDMIKGLELAEIALNTAPCFPVFAAGPDATNSYKIARLVHNARKEAEAAKS